MCKYISRYGLLLMALLTLSLRADNYVIINQVMYDSPLNEKTNESPYSNGEFIELYNAGADTVSLSGWKLTDGSVAETYEFDTDVKIPNGAYLVIACRRGETNTFNLSDLFPFMPENATVLYQRKVVLSNSGETLTLLNSVNDTIDQMYYDGTSHMSIPDRLHADNPDSISGNQCVSLHRTWVEFDAEGKVTTGTSQWQTALVSFHETMLPKNTYYEDYLFGEQSLPVGENYVLSVEPLDPVSRIDINAGRMSVSSGVRTRTILAYLDGLGREEQTIVMNATPGNQDLVSTTEYSDKRHVSRQWMPAVMQTEGQRMDVTDIRSQAQSDYEDSRPYSESSYENSVRKRPISQVRQGNSYQSSPATQTYSLNSENDLVRIYSVVDSSLQTEGVNYNEATLYKSTISDEDGKSVSTYTDKQGKKIMEERGGERIYYVYDDMERLRYILPHAAQSKLTNGTYNLNHVVLRADAYYYNYDDRGNLIYKRLPGCEPQYMVYDQLGQLILKQDGNQRAKGKWTLCAYDSIGRNLYIAEIPLEQSHAFYVTFYADKWAVEHYGNNHSFPITGTGYASRLLGKTDLHPLIINYYDDYSFLNLLPTPVRQALRFVQESGYGTQHDNATGLLTGRRIYNLSDEEYVQTAYYYDTHGQIVQSRSTRHADGYAVTSTKYHFDGSIAQQLITQGTDSDLVREHYRYIYDHAGRLTETHYRLNNDEEITFSAFSYDSIGRLVQNLLHQNKDTIRYSYDVRNMLTKLHNRHFSERLFYADSVSAFVGASPNYNGNIAVSRITNADTAFVFTYAYDTQNRLTAASQLTGYGSVFSEQLTYDDAGNILTFKRFNNHRKIDDLTYDYGNEGNRLLSITDNGQGADQYDVIEYHNSNIQADTTFRYDANGNLIYDLDRGISVIKYNILNLPDTIQFSNGNQIVNLYDAAGRKYKTITYFAPETAGTSHYEIEHYTFDTDTVTYAVTEYAGNIETLIGVDSTRTRRIHNTIGYYSDSTYFHYIKDHLGNVCAVVNSTRDSVIQSTLYYASGVLMAQSFGRDKQPYLYNGKEFVEAHGWNTYDYGFRGYYATIGRFTSIDPLAEQTPWQSPYAYADNNFINAIDWMGLGGATGFSHSGDVCQYIVIDIQGNYLGGVDNDDDGIYLDPDGNWKPKDGKEDLERVGRMMFPFWVYENWIGLGKKAPGFYYKNNYSISISGSIGFQAAFPAWKGDIGVSLPAWDLFEASYAWNEGYNLNYFAKEGKANISLGIDYLGIKYEYSLQYKVKSGYQVPGTFFNGFSYQPNQYLDFDVSSSGHMSLTFSFGIGVVCSITISGDFYYE